MADLQEAVKKFASDLADKMNTFMTDIGTLEVRTYTTPADQVATEVKGKADFANILTEGKAVLRAYTSVAFDGDTTVWAPVDAAGEINVPVWNLHQVMVQQALENRAAMIKSLGEAAATALKALQHVG